MLSEEFIKEAKNFRRQMKWCAIICWVATLPFIFSTIQSNDKDWLIIPIGGFIFSLIYFNMNKNIKKYESNIPRF